MPDTRQSLEAAVAELVAARSQMNACLRDLGASHTELLTVLDQWIVLAVRSRETSTNVNLPKVAPPTLALRLIPGGKQHLAE